MSMATLSSVLPMGFTVRHNLKAGDLGYIVYLHGTTYAAEYGFDATFEAYVAEPLSAFVRLPTSQDRLWVVEREGGIVGCIAIVGVSDKEAQLRWFLVDASARGVGLGRYLLAEAISFCKNSGYESLFLWTVSALTTAAKLYHDVGFRKTAENRSRQWGVDVIEEKYDLRLNEMPTSKAE